MATPADITISVDFGLCKDAIACLVWYNLVKKVTGQNSMCLVARIQENVMLS
jgi:hypothetical protein